jgi:hypothetical protein
MADASTQGAVVKPLRKQLDNSATDPCALHSATTASQPAIALSPKLSRAGRFAGAKAVAHAADPEFSTVA